MIELLSWATAIITLATAIFALGLAVAAIISYKKVKHFIVKYIDQRIGEIMNENKKIQFERKKKGLQL